MSHSVVRRSIPLLIVVGLFAGVVQAAPPCINYQGILSDNLGAPLQGTYALYFEIYSGDSEPEPLWTEGQDVDVDNGVFHVVLGVQNPLPLDLFDGSQRWLGVTVDEGAQLVPRTRITSVPWALRAAVADSVAGGGANDGDWTLNGGNMYAAVAGNVGIGSTTPARKLQIGQTTTPNSEGMIRLVSRSGTNGSNRVWDVGVPETDGDSSGIGYSFILDDVNTGTGPEFMVKWGTGRVGIGTTAPGALLDVAGTARVEVLEIVGADLAERFPMSEAAGPGAVVVIDPDRPGSLRLSREPYDRRIAGVISGANGLSVGAVMGQCTTDPGAEALAMSGRVWTLCDATEQAVEPGDLLTSSSRPGYAMVAVEADRSHGAVLGKSMTRLEQGRTGYVLVLVNLQ